MCKFAHTFQQRTLFWIWWENMDFTINLEFNPIDHTESKELFSHSFHIKSIYRIIDVNHADQKLHISKINRWRCTVLWNGRTILMRLIMRVCIILIHIPLVSSDIQGSCSHHRDMTSLWWKLRLWIIIIADKGKIHLNHFFLSGRDWGEQAHHSLQPFHIICIDQKIPNLSFFHDIY